MKELNELYELYYDELDDYDIHNYAIGFDHMYGNNLLFKCIADNFAKYRNDLITSDREAAAFCMAMGVMARYGSLSDLIQTHAYEWTSLKLTHDEQWREIKEIENIEEKFNTKISLLSEEKEKEL